MVALASSMYRVLRILRCVAWPGSWCLVAARRQHSRRTRLGTTTNSQSAKLTKWRVESFDKFNENQTGNNREEAQES